MWPKYWSFSFNVSSSNEYSGLISNGLVGSPCKPRDSQESSPTAQFKIINFSVFSFFIVQISHPYMTAGKTIALTRWKFAGKVMSLLFNMLSRLVIAFLPRSKHLLISLLQSHLHWFWSPRKENVSLFPLFPHLFAKKWWDWMPWSLFFECWVLSQLFLSHLHQEAP